jgi:hypothetical protein
MRRISGLLGLVAVLSCACARGDQAQDVMVFRNEQAVTQPFEVVSVISFNNVGKDKVFTVFTLNDAIPKLKEQARAVGANAIIIDESTPLKSGLVSRGISVKARAVLIKAQEQTKQ